MGDSFGLLTFTEISFKIFTVHFLFKTFFAFKIEKLSVGFCSLRNPSFLHKYIVQKFPNDLFLNDIIFSRSLR